MAARPGPPITITSQVSRRRTMLLVWLRIVFLKVTLYYGAVYTGFPPVKEIPDRAPPDNPFSLGHGKSYLTTYCTGLKSMPPQADEVHGGTRPALWKFQNLAVVVISQHRVIICDRAPCAVPNRCEP